MTLGLRQLFDICQGQTPREPGPLSHVNADQRDRMLDQLERIHAVINARLPSDTSMIIAAVDALNRRPHI